MGNSIEVSNINANSIKVPELECNQTSLKPTLATSMQNMHVPTNLNDAASESTTKINDHPTSIRTWKRLMRQVNLAGAENKCDEKIKRKLSTCMHGDFHRLSKQKVASDEDQPLVKFNDGSC